MAAAQMEGLPLHLLRQVWEEDARRHLSFFMEYSSEGRWKPARHHELLCQKLEAVERGEIRRLMVFLPPRHGKSEVVSRGFPAWFLGRNPDKEVMVASYAADLAFDFSRRARATFRDWGYKLWGLNLATDSSAVEHWEVAGHRGGLTAAGVGGPITGRGAHIAVIDDPIKNQDEAASEIIRARVKEWYRTTLRTRLAPAGAIVVVQTRWHQDDLSGWLLQEMEQGGEQWEVINLPALAEAEDLLGRELGEPLWPERGFDLAWAEATKRAVGSTAWSALYQQRPSPAEGGLLKRTWWKYYETAPASFDQALISWDMAFKDSDTSDYVVGQVWGRVGADCYLLDVIRDRLDFPATVAAVRRLADKWPGARPILIEDKANGSAVVSTLRREVPGIVPVNPEGGKQARASAVAPYIEAGNIHLPTRSAWVNDFVEEAAAFPAGSHDDQVDAMSQALLRLVGRRSGGGTIMVGGWPGKRRRSSEEDDDDDRRPELHFYAR